MVAQKLRRLSVLVLSKLLIEWVERFAVRRREANVERIKDYLEDKLKDKIGRAELASLIVAKYWSKGLNMFQLAEVDTLVLFQHPKSYVWNCHFIYENESDLHSTLIMPDDFSENLRSLLSVQGQKNHIYCKRHPTLPLNVFRIQLYDISRNDQHVSQRAPFYIATTIAKSPVIFHTNYGQYDIYAKLIMQLTKETLLMSEKAGLLHPQTISSGRSATYLVLKDEGPVPTKNLENIAKLAGVDGTGDTMAAWSGYSKDTADTTPLTDGRKHRSATGRKSLSNAADKSNLQKKSMLRFKGKELAGAPEYDSEIPVEKATFSVIDEHKGRLSTNQIEFKIALNGKDVYGGLHELCDQGMLDVEHLPGWICGEHGNKSGTIKFGQFTDNRSNGGLI